MSWEREARVAKRGLNGSEGTMLGGGLGLRQGGGFKVETLEK